MNGLISNFSFKFIDQDQVFKEIKKLDENKASQKKISIYIYDIPFKIMKENIAIIYYTLYHNFNNSSFYSEFPSKLKEADITPVY